MTVSGKVTAKINVTYTGSNSWVALVYGAKLTDTNVISSVEQVNTDKASCMLNGKSVTDKYVGQTK